MAVAPAENAVRNYLSALADPASLRNEQELEELQSQIGNSADPVERLRLRQQLHAAQNPSLDQYEEDFVQYAREWAEENGVNAEVFLEEGVPAQVLRRAGFRVGGRGGRRPRRNAQRTRTRVTADEVRAAIPKGTFTIKDLQEASGASLAVVRRVVQEALEAGKVVDAGTAPRGSGPGRAARQFKRSR